MRTDTLHPAVQKLRDRLGVQVIGSADPEFDSARTTYYSLIDRRPCAIVKVANDADISRVVSLARESGVTLSVRSGGHSALGHCIAEGGIVIDLSNMRKIEIDSDRRTAWAETGLTAAQYVSESGKHGLTTGFGDAGSVGIGGITLGGGIGFLVRKYGLTIDDVLAADLVTADGKTLRADPKNHPDLFWALRGGGGNFGVVTRFQYRLHAVDKVLGGILMLPATSESIQSFVALADAAPEELSAIVNVGKAPPMPFIPPEQHGKPIIMAMMVYAGPIEEGERVIAPFRAIARPFADMIRPISYPEMYAGEGPHPAAFSARTMFVKAIDTLAADAIMDHLRGSSASMAVAQIRILGGAMARVPVDATAFAHRQQRFLVNVAALYERREDAGVQDAWVESLTQQLRPDRSAVYVNFLNDEGDAHVRKAYPGPTYDRLARVKATYDPENVFHHNHNVRPAAPGAKS